MSKHARISHHPSRTARRERAAALLAVSSKQTPEERLTALDDRLGKDRGATKERLRLHGLIARGGRGPNVTEVLFEAPGEPGEEPKRTKAKDRRAQEKKLAVRQ